MQVVSVDNEWITLADGCRLAARLWLPADAGQHPVPAILEYLPYRKDDATANQDATRHPYFAAQGYGAVRVDLRGTGDSDGILCDEYLASEQDDALEVIAWIAEQPWCTGDVGMIGYSWGGFNGLQIAARRPPQLKAVVTMYSTDDRYADDCHYMGGCLLGSDMLKWASSMRAHNALPPDPRFREDWREVWLARLAETPAFIEPWLSHQTRDAYWKHGSVAENYSAIEAATLVVGGWTDAYTNAVPRLLEHLTCERRGIIGPWAHVVPYAGVPGPAIGFLRECVRWFDRWLKGIDTGVEADPLLRVWMQDSVPPATYYDQRPGRWIAEKTWPPAGVEPQRWPLAAGTRLAPTAVASSGDHALVLQSPQHVGQTAGVWCANGMRDELPGDQRADDELSVCFDFEPLDAPLEVLGFPVVRLVVSVDQPLALLAARLCEVAPDGASTLVSWGLLNLTHRGGHEHPESVTPGAPVTVEFALNAIGHRFSAGNRLRLALSSTYWPHAWPSPEPVALAMQADGDSALKLPVLCRPDAELRAPFGAPPESTRAGASHRDAERTRVRGLDPVTGMHAIADREVSSAVIAESGTTYARVSEDTYRIGEDDPLSASVEAVRDWSLSREGWSVRVVAQASMTADKRAFHVDDLLEAFEGEQLVFERRQRFSVRRNGV